MRRDDPPSKTLLYVFGVTVCDGYWLIHNSSSVGGGGGGGGADCLPTKETNSFVCVRASPYVKDRRPVSEQRVPLWTSARDPAE